MAAGPGRFHPAGVDIRSRPAYTIRGFRSGCKGHGVKASRRKPRADKAAAAVSADRRGGRIGVVDIGSNTVRLVVYEVPTRLPFPLFNEKAQCELGRGVADSGRLNPEGVPAAIRALGRFVALAEAMGVDKLDLVATAAVRDAADGPDFVAEVERRYGHPVNVIDGAEEAQLAALGVLSGVPYANGLLGDLGGGSLDLVELTSGAFGRSTTLPLGHLRLSRESADRGAAAETVASHLLSIPWLDEVRGRDLYASGGSWRTVARVILDQMDWPLHVIDNFEVSGADALGMLDVIAGLGRASIRRIPDISRRRMDSLPVAALVLGMLVEAARPARLAFSAFGMREGRMLKSLPADIRAQDPLIAGCLGHAERTGRFSLHGEEILTWTAPLFDGETAAQARLRLAACLLSDISWGVHPDYRFEHAFERVVRLPFAGLRHADRAWLGIALLVRYGGEPASPLAAPVLPLLDEEGMRRAVTTGHALRLAHSLTGGAPGLLARTTLRRTRAHLVLELPRDDTVYRSEAVERHLGRLARSLGLKTRISASRV